MGMIVLRRLAFAIPLLLAVSFATFLLVAFAPGDAARVLAGPEATPAEYAALRTQLGLDDSVFVQYVNWLAHTVQGDLGTSIVNGQPVAPTLNERLGVTLSLVVPAVAISSALGILIGCVSAHRGGWLGRTVDAMAVLGNAFPSYWIALVVMTVFAVNLGLFPAIGYVSPADSPTGWLQSITLPVLSLVIGGLALTAKQTRNAMLSGLSAEYARAHRADGVPERTIVYRHVLRNSAAPIIATIGLHFVGALGGTVLVEKIFGLPGLGGIAVSSTELHDMPTIQGVVVYFAVLVVLINLLLDLVYQRLNPRVAIG